MNRYLFSPKQEIFLEYLLSQKREGKTKLPSISKMSGELGISSTSLREQIELARNLGLIHIQPKTGITILPYNFSPPVTKSLYFAVNTDKQFFDQYSDLRNQIELAYFAQAAALLSDENIGNLRNIVNSAKQKLDGSPKQIPHSEHRSFHVAIYKSLENVFIDGLLQSYWDLYELTGLDTYADINYLHTVWRYHEKIVDAIESKDFDEGYLLLSEHICLLDKRE